MPDRASGTDLQQERPQCEPYDDRQTPPAAKHTSSKVQDAHPLPAKIFSLEIRTPITFARAWRTVMPWADQ
jgi:hypothetical protein